jgi:hypothetical protein
MQISTSVGVVQVILFPSRCCAFSADYTSVPERSVIVVVDLAVAGAIVPVPLAIAAVLGRTLQPISSEAGAVAAETCVVFQRRPRQRIVILADAEKSAERRYGIRDLTADLVDHDALYAPDLLINASCESGFLVPHLLF